MEFIEILKVPKVISWAKRTLKWRLIAFAFLAAAFGCVDALHGLSAVDIAVDALLLSAVLSTLDLYLLFSLSVPLQAVYGVTSFLSKLLSKPLKRLLRWCLAHKTALCAGFLSCVVLYVICGKASPYSLALILCLIPLVYIDKIVGSEEPLEKGDPDNGGPTDEGTDIIIVPNDVNAIQAWKRNVEEIPDLSDEEFRLWASLTQKQCDHISAYESRAFDALNGFEIVATRCSQCHKVLALSVKKLGG